MSAKTVATCVFMVLGDIQAGRRLHVSTDREKGGPCTRADVPHGGDCRGPMQLMQLKDVVPWAMHLAGDRAGNTRDGDRTWENIGIVVPLKGDCPMPRTHVSCWLQVIRVIELADELFPTDTSPRSLPLHHQGARAWRPPAGP